MAWRSRQGKFWFDGVWSVGSRHGGHGSVRYVELGGARSVEARRSGHGTLWYGTLRCVQLRRGGRGTVR